MSRIPARATATTLIAASLAGCPSSGSGLPADWQATGSVLQPPAEWSVSPREVKPDAVLADEANAPGRDSEASPGETVRRTYAQGPMVFSANTVMTYRLRPLSGWFPEGSMELLVQRFEPQNHGFDLEVESRFTVGWLSRNQAWKALVDDDWIQVDGKSMMPQRATPGMYWPSINGTAGLTGLERVDTELATFPDCWKVLYVEGNGEPTEAWFAPGVGLVKARFTVAGLRAEALLTKVTP